MGVPSSKMLGIEANSVNFSNFPLLMVQNYSTFYNYNDQGVLTHIERETDKGRVTIKESRQSHQHHIQ